MAKSRKAPAAVGCSLASKRHEASLDLKGEREEKNKAHGGRFRSPRFGRKSGPGTPVPCWKLYENRSYDAFARGSGKIIASKVNALSNGNSGKRRNSSNTDACFVVSARKLAASVWALQQPQDSRRKRASASISSTIHRLKNQGSSDLQDLEVFIISVLFLFRQISFMLVRFRIISASRCIKFGINVSILY